VTTALDTSVLVAALAAWHERHDACRVAVGALLSGDEPPLVPDHAVVESFSVLTRLPVAYRISPEDARALLRDALRGRARVVGERADAVWGLLDAAVGSGIAGGAVYDLRILRSAVRAGATRLLTLNPTDFERFAVADVEIAAP
jgi:predicted nucleic acid-binding protein